MNLNYNKWRARSLFESLDSEMFECIHCDVVVKHPLLHYIKYHRYVRQLPLLRLKRWLRNAYVSVYNRWFDSITRLRVNKIRKNVNEVIDKRIKMFSHKYKKETEWHALLRLEREVLVCMEVVIL